jgi:hypothetical protein
MHTIFTAAIPPYVRPNGLPVPATDAAIFGSILTANGTPARDLTLGEARAALLNKWPSLANVPGIEIKRSPHPGYTWQCDIIPAYCL